jgi:hypothetical protein
LSSLDHARQTQLNNIQAKTGKSLDQVKVLISKSGLTRHSEIRQLLMDKLGLGYGDANSLVHFAHASDGQSAAEVGALTGEAVLAGIYSGAKEPLRPIHEKIMLALGKFGAFETVPKKGYLSLRRKRQFAMVGPGTKGRLEVGLNAKDLSGSARLVSLPAGGMCQYKVFLTSPKEVDQELLGWLRKAYDGSA